MPTRHTHIHTYRKLYYIRLIDDESENLRPAAAAATLLPETDDGNQTQDESNPQFLPTILVHPATQNDPNAPP